MHRIVRSWMASLLILAASAPVQAAATAPAAERTVRGSYVWEQGDEKGNFKAVFAPAGDLRWDVSFRFKFGGEAHIYTGTAEGPLDNGVLSGRVESDGHRRIFTFRGEVRGGEFTGTHAEVVDGQEYRSGTLTMRVKP